MNEYSYLQNINGREDFFPKSCQTKRDTHTLILFSPAVWKQRIRTEHPSLIKPYYTDHTALHASVSTRIVHRTSTVGQSLFCIHPRNTKMSPFLCFSLPPTVSACPISDHKTSCSHSTWGNSLRFTKPNNNGVPKRTKGSPSITPTSSPPGTPLSGGKAKPDGP